MSNAPDYRSKEEVLNAVEVDELPEGWEGGDVVHTGGSIFLRRFRNYDEEVEVVFNPDNPAQGVGVQYIKQTEDGGWRYDDERGLIEQIEVDESKEEKLVEIALSRMARISEEGIS